MQLNGPAKSCLIATSGSLAKGFLTVASGGEPWGGGGAVLYLAEKAASVLDWDS